MLSQPGTSIALSGLKSYERGSDGRSIQGSPCLDRWGALISFHLWQWNYDMVCPGLVNYSVQLGSARFSSVRAISDIVRDEYLIPYLSVQGS